MENSIPTSYKKSVCGSVLAMLATYMGVMADFFNQFGRMSIIHHCLDHCRSSLLLSS